MSVAQPPPPPSPSHSYQAAVPLTNHRVYRRQYDAGEVETLPQVQRQQRCDVMCPAALGELLEFFYSDATRESADVKNVRRHRVGHKEWVQHATRWREGSLRELYGVYLVTLMVVIINYLVGDEEVCEHHFFLSDVKDHSSTFVQRSLDMLVEELTGRGLRFRAHHFFTDGAAAHFKSKSAFMGAVAHASRHEVEVIWSFFASSHGKGEWDGAGATLKHMVGEATKQKDTPLLKCAGDVVALAKRRWNKLLGCGKALLRRFYEVTGQHLQGYAVTPCSTVPGTREIHSLRASPVEVDAAGLVLQSPTVYTREWACCCKECLDQRWDDCENKGYLPDWKPTVLKLVGHSGAQPFEGAVDDSLSEEACAEPELSYAAVEVSTLYCGGIPLSLPCLQTLARPTPAPPPPGPGRRGLLPTAAEGPPVCDGAGQDRPHVRVHLQREPGGRRAAPREVGHGLAGHGRSGCGLTPPDCSLPVVQAGWRGGGVWCCCKGTAGAAPGRPPRPAPEREDGGHQQAAAQVAAPSGGARRHQQRLQP